MAPNAIESAQSDLSATGIPFADCEAVLALKENIGSCNWCQLQTDNNGSIGIPYGTISQVQDNKIVLEGGAQFTFSDSKEVFFFIIQTQASKPKVRVLNGDWIVFAMGYALVLRPFSQLN